MNYQEFSFFQSPQTADGKRSTGDDDCLSDVEVEEDISFLPNLPDDSPRRGPLPQSDSNDSMDFPSPREASRRKKKQNTIARPSSGEKLKERAAAPRLKKDMGHVSFANPFAKPMFRQRSSPTHGDADPEDIEVLVKTPPHEKLKTEDEHEKRMKMISFKEDQQHFRWMNRKTGRSRELREKSKENLKAKEGTPQQEMAVEVASPAPPFRTAVIYALSTLLFAIYFTAVLPLAYAEHFSDIGFSTQDFALLFGFYFMPPFPCQMLSMRPLKLWGAFVTLLLLFSVFLLGYGTFVFGVEEAQWFTILGGRLVCGATTCTIESILCSILALWCEDILGWVHSFLLVVKFLAITAGILVPRFLHSQVGAVLMIESALPIVFIPWMIVLLLTIIDRKLWSHVPLVPGREDVYRVKSDTSFSAYRCIFSSLFWFHLFIFCESFLVMGYTVGGVGFLQKAFPTADISRHEALAIVSAGWATSCILQCCEFTDVVGANMRRQALLGSFMLVVGFCLCDQVLEQDYLTFCWFLMIGLTLQTSCDWSAHLHKADVSLYFALCVVNSNVKSLGYILGIVFFWLLTEKLSPAWVYVCGGIALFQFCISTRAFPFVAVKRSTTKTIIREVNIPADDSTVVSYTSQTQSLNSNQENAARRNPAAPASIASHASRSTFMSFEQYRPRDMDAIEQEMASYSNPYLNQTYEKSKK